MSNITLDIRVEGDLLFLFGFSSSTATATTWRGLGVLVLVGGVEGGVTIRMPLLGLSSLDDVEPRQQQQHPRSRNNPTKQRNDPPMIGQPPILAVAGIPKKFERERERERERRNNLLSDKELVAGRLVDVLAAHYLR